MKKEIKGFIKIDFEQRMIDFWKNEKLLSKNQISSLLLSKDFIELEKKSREGKLYSFTKEGSFFKEKENPSLELPENAVAIVELSKLP